MNKFDLGVDLSQHNGYVDFVKLKNAGCKYVILRLGWIGNKENHTLDTYFKDYYKKAKEVGLPIGLYVYSYCKSLDAINSACKWIENQINIQNLKLELPIFLDLEDGSTVICGKENLTNQAINFCEYFKNKGYDVGIYANKYWFTSLLDINRLLDYKIWLAEWSNQITFKYKVDLWQFTSKGHFDGITTNVDINKVMCDCQNDNSQPVEKPVDNLKNEVYIEMKKYKNGTTIEKVYSDTRLSRMVGYLNPFEECDCLGIQNNLGIVKYKIDKTNDYKIGFVKWLGGIK